MGYVKTAVALMDRQGLFAEGTEWESARQRALDAEPADMDEAYVVVREALKVAGGKHSFLISPETVQENDTSKWEMPVVTVDTDGVAIIRLPEFLGNKEEGRKYVSAVLDGLPDELTGAVIDLRGNTGGNMYPMTASVHRFIGDGENMLRFRSRKRTQAIPLSYVLRIQGVEERPLYDCPVALLTDSLTASSGEALLICFRGLDNVRTFGGSTAGYASANVPIPMSDGSHLVITTSCDMARTDEVFCDDPIAPDVFTETPLDDALAWIASLTDE